MESPNHYEILCVSADASADDIRAAYRRLMRLYHPDVAGESGAAMTLRFNEASRVLLDPVLRRHYDSMLRMPAAARAGGASGAGTRSSNGARSEGSGYAGASGGRDGRDWRPTASGGRPGAGSADRGSAGRGARPARRAVVWDPAVYLFWLGVLSCSVVVIVLSTGLAFAYCYSGPLTFDTPRLEPVLVIGLAWLVGALGRPPKVLISLLVIGAAIWPLATAGIAPFSGLVGELPAVVLALPTIVAVAVLTFRISVPCVTALARSRPRAAAASHPRSRAGSRSGRAGRSFHTARG